ncbi:transposable element Tcb2 transposase [Trichonephila clavipes]|nr:transposable element Tcb2 transposase [Trichonephila clavipes]
MDKGIMVADSFRSEQEGCAELALAWKYAKEGKGNYYEVDEYLFRRDKNTRGEYWAAALSSREQLIREQRKDPELGHIYRYLENPDDGSVIATVWEGWNQDFKLIDGLLFYSKYSISLEELRVYIPQSFRESIMQEFHDVPLAGHLGKRKTYLKLRGTYYFPYKRKYLFEYVSTCGRCQKFNYKNSLPTGLLIPIVSNFPNEIVMLELILLRKASAQAIANAFFRNYISRYGIELLKQIESGESRFNLSSNDNRVRMWKPRVECIDTAFALQRPTAPTAGGIVWGLIAYTIRPPLLLTRGTLLSQRYVHDILQPHVLSLMQRLPGVILQQENVRPHTARVSQDYLSTVTTLLWPSRSTDMSPI